MKNFIVLVLLAMLIISCESPMDINQNDFNQLSSKATFKHELYYSARDYQYGYDSGMIGTSWVNLEWTKSAEKDFLVYKLYRNDDVIKTWNDINVVAYKDTLLNMNTVYEYRIATFKKNTMSDYDTLSIKTANWQTPVDLFINGLDHDLVRLSWTDRSDLEEYITILLEESTDGYNFTTINTIELAANTIEYLWNNLEDNKYYRYGLTYINEEMPELNTVYSNEFEASDFVLNIPYGLSAVCNTDLSIVLTWDDNSTLETSFLIERSINSNDFRQIAQTEMNINTYPDVDTTSYQLGDTLRYRIRDYNSYAGEYSEYSAVAEVVVQEFIGFFENFEDGVADNWIDDNTGRWNVTNHKYIFESTGSFKDALTYYNQQFADFTYEAEFTVVSGENASFGLYFRGDGILTDDDYNNGYIFDIYVDSYSNESYFAVFYNFNGSSYALFDWEYTDLININGTNSIKVICDGNNMNFYINDVLVEDIYDETFSEGYVGLWAGDAYYYNTISFDNINLSLSTRDCVAGKTVNPIKVNSDTLHTFRRSE